MGLIRLLHRLADSADPPVGGVKFPEALPRKLGSRVLPWGLIPFIWGCVKPAMS
jgi:hypothetical protein